MSSDLGIRGNTQPLLQVNSPACASQRVVLIALGVVSLLGGALAAWMTYAHIGQWSWVVLGEGAALGIGLMISGACLAPTSKLPMISHDEVSPSAAPTGAARSTKPAKASRMPGQPVQESHPLIFSELSPLDVKIRILSFLTGEEMAQCQRVCGEWRGLSLSAQILRKKMNIACVKAAARLKEIPYGRARSLVKVAEVEKDIDPEQALETLYEAKALVPLIEDLNNQICALLEVVKVEFGIDRDRAQATLEAAQATALSVADPRLRVINVWEVIETGVTIDRNLARTTALLIDDPEYRARALLAVLRGAEGIDWELALETLRGARAAALLIQNLYQRASYLVGVVRVAVGIDTELAKMALQEAVEVARAIDEHKYRAEALLEAVSVAKGIDQNLAKVVLQEARAAAQSIDYRERARMLLGVVRCGVDIDRELALEALQEAKAAVLSPLPVREKKDLILFEVVKVEADIDCERAKSTARLIKDPQSRASALFGVLIVEVGINQEVAKATLQEVKASAILIKDLYEQHRALHTVVKLGLNIDRPLALATLEEVKNSARAIDPSNRAEALLEVAKVEMSVDREQALATLQEARDSICSIEHPYSQVYALLEIGEVEIDIDHEQGLATLQEAKEILLAHRSSFDVERLIRIAKH
ncbi:hypothetical protein ACFLR2_00885 [Chlamydiota bacterium]